MNVSRDQQQAIEFFDGNVCVFAGAGSGKTSILVERFLYAIVQKKMDPGRILAITFTEKAANEMKTRLVETCDKRGLSEIRRKLESAYISTIHGFCARLLKENPIEAGVDPFFQILGQGEAEILMDEAIDALCEAESQNEDGLAILGDYGESDLRRILKGLYSQSRALADEPGLLGCEAKANQPHAIELKINSLAKEILERLDDHSEKKTEENLKRGLSQILSVLEGAGDRGWAAVRAVNDAAPLMHKRGAHKQDIGRLHEWLGDWQAAVVQDLGIPTKRTFVRLFHRFKEAYEAAKQKRAAIDFDDLLYLAYRLLSGDSIERKKIHGHYQDLFFTILVDECQDTSPLQAKIIELLQKKNNLFVVGDVQQSIYGFRHAEPEVFQRLGSSNGSERAKKIVLAENYRSRPEILFFVNEVFQPIFPETTFSPLIPKRSAASGNPDVVELLCVEPRTEETITLDKGRVLEAAAIARRIKDLVEKEGRMEYRDIAILFRTTTSSHLYEKELTDLGIPTSAAKSSGFFSKTEITDVVNLLELVENPHRDIPLAAVLRSPLVQISDDALFWLARAAKKGDETQALWRAFEHLESLKEISEIDRRKLLAFKTFWERLRKYRNDWHLSELVGFAIRETNQEAMVLAQPNGRQKVANLWKLVELARSVESRGIFGIEAFIRFLKNLSERETVEPEARIAGESENSVLLSTVHAAKGLEFACVIVADMGGEGAKNRYGNILAHRDWGLGFKLKDPSSGEWFAEQRFRQIQEALKKKEAAEDYRLLYVAMTRAKEHLILSGVNNRSSWMAEMSKTIESRGIKIKKLPWKDRWETNEIVPLPIKTQKTTAILPLLVPLVIKSYEEAIDLTVTDLLADLPEGKLARELSLDVKEEELSDIPEDSLPRNEFGTIFHRLIEGLVSQKPRRIPPSFFRAPWIRALSVSDRTELEKSVTQFWNSAWGEEVRKAKRCYTELPFIYKTKYGLLKGQMDLVLQTHEGDWVILDYKTNRFKASDREALVSVYEWQLACYAAVFKEIYGEAPRKGVLYFSYFGNTSEFFYGQKDFGMIKKRLSRMFRERCSSKTA